MITIIGIDGAWKIVNAITDPRCSITINNDMGIICNFIFPIQIATKLFPKDLTTFKSLPIGFILKFIITTAWMSFSPTFVNNTKFNFTTLRSEEHTSELQSRLHLVFRLLLENKK